MDAHSAGVDVRFQGILGVRERGKFKSHDKIAPYVRIADLSNRKIGVLILDQATAKIAFRAAACERQSVAIETLRQFSF